MKITEIKKYKTPHGMIEFYPVECGYRVVMNNIPFAWYPVFKRPTKEIAVFFTRKYAAIQEKLEDEFYYCDRKIDPPTQEVSHE